MYLEFIIKSALEDLRRSKVRTFLTSLGILIGVMSVVLLMALGFGLKKYIENQFESIGTNLVMIMPGQGLSGGFSPSTMTAGAIFDDEDVKKLKKIDNVTVTTPFIMTYQEAQAEGESEIYEILGTDETVFDAMNLEIDRGRFMTSSDVQKGSKVAVLGANPAEKLFGSAENAIGKKVKLGDQSFEVIGATKSKGGSMGPGIDDHIISPYKAIFNFTSRKKFYAIYLKTVDDEDVSQVKEDTEELLLKRYDEDDFSVSDQKETINTLSSIFNMVNIVLVGIAAISLVVGGVGVMNIMYVSVAERIQEIGIKRAVGATGQDILLQFLAEAVILSLFGGVLALAISYGIILIVQRYFPAYIDIRTVFLSLGVSSGIGVVFGVFPAKKASDLTPIEAIRHE